MTVFSQLPLQQTIYETLTADATLDGMVAGIFDHVPQATDYPFITIGECALREFSNLEKQGMEAQVTLRVFSREAGRKQALLIMERITHLLHHASLSVSGQTLVDSRFVSSAIVLEGDGLTYRGTLIFVVRLRENA